MNSNTGPELFTQNKFTSLDKRIVPAIKCGRGWNGAHRDAGDVVHAVEPLPSKTRGDWFTKAICGAEPGRRGNGWVKTNREINCPKCLKKLAASIQQPKISFDLPAGSHDAEDRYWQEDGKSWYQYIHSEEIIRQNDENYSGKHFRHKRCPFCNRITCMATLHWYNHLKKCAPPEYSMADIGELRYKKPDELRGTRIGR